MHTQRRSIISHKDVSIFGSATQGLLQKKAKAAHQELIGLIEVFRYDPSYRLAAFAGGGVLLFFVISFSIFLISLQPQNGGVQAAAVIPSASTIVQSDAPPVEVNIARTGLTLLRGAHIVEVNGTILTVSTVWGSTHFTWTVHTDSTRYETRNFGTHFLDHQGERISPEDVRVGDFVTVSGTLDTSAQQPTLHADSVRRLH